MSERIADTTGHNRVHLFTCLGREHVNTVAGDEQPFERVVNTVDGGGEFALSLSAWSPWTRARRLEHDMNTLMNTAETVFISTAIELNTVGRAWHNPGECRQRCRFGASCSASRGQPGDIAFGIADHRMPAFHHPSWGCPGIASAGRSLW